MTENQTAIQYVASDLINNIKNLTNIAQHFDVLTKAESENIKEGIVSLRNGESFAVQKGFDVDWNHVFKTNTATTNLYFYSLHYVGSTLLEFERTRDAIYLEIAYSIADGFFSFISEPAHRVQVETNRGGGSRDHGTAIRVSVFCLLLKHLALTNLKLELQEKIAEYLVQSALWLEDDSNHSSNNHGLMSDVALAQVGVAIGLETEIGRRFVLKADKRLTDLILLTFDRDGYANENGIGYHRYNLTKYAEALKLFLTWNISGSFVEVAPPIISKAEGALSNLVWQDGSIPPIGDWPVYPIGYRSDNRSKLFVESGFAVIKNDDLYVSLVCGYRGTAHKHVDDTSITVRYRNQDVVIDAGNYSFDRTSPYRKCLESSYGHSGCFIDTAEGLLTSQYLELKPRGQFLAWNETQAGVTAVVELDFGDSSAKITRTVKVIWPATIFIEDIVTAHDDCKAITARQGWVLGRSISRQYRQDSARSIHLSNEAISATFCFHEFLDRDKLTFNTGAHFPISRGWCSEKDGEILPTLELSHYKTGKAVRFVTSIKLSAIDTECGSVGEAACLDSAWAGVLQSRAAMHVRQSNLVVDYYRVRRKLAFLLPVTRFPNLGYKLRGYPQDKTYPWSIWMAWELEERIETLGYASEWFDDEMCRRAVISDLWALASWPTYLDSKRIGLPYAHIVRTLWLAYIRWKWLPNDLQSALRNSLIRAVDDAVPMFDQTYGQMKLVADFISDQSCERLHNTNVIGVVALALAAQAVSHAYCEEINDRVAIILSSLFERRKKKVVEGPTYDGYIFSFVFDWLSESRPELTEKLLTPTMVDDILSEFLFVTAPGDVHEMAALGDVEPMQMTFHLSGMAKLHRLKPTSQLAWLFSRCEPRLLRTDALVALCDESSATSPDDTNPAVGALNTPAATVLRTGYSRNDVAVVIAASNSPMNHIQCDNGSLVIGTEKRWFIDDPGYQQYLNTSEREFTIGVHSHNTPVVNGVGQTIKSHRKLSIGSLSPDLLYASLDLTACYPTQAQLTLLTREVWLCGKEHVVVCDRIKCNPGASISYSWHGHPDVAWQVQDKVAYLYDEFGPTGMWICSPQVAVDEKDILRLSGSRGHLTLTANIHVGDHGGSSYRIWWVFSFAEERPCFNLDALSVRVGEYELCFTDGD